MINVADELPHIIEDDFKKDYYTACGIKFNKNKKLTTLSYNCFVDKICQKCLDQFKNHSLKISNRDARVTYSNQSFLTEILYLQKENIIGPKMKFESILTKRAFPFLRKFKKNVRSTK